MSDRDIRYRGRNRLRRASVLAPQLAARVASPLVPDADLSPQEMRLRNLREGLIADLGGNPSEAALLIIDQAIMQASTLSAVNQLVLELSRKRDKGRGLASQKTNKLYQLVREQAQLGAYLSRLLKTLGLDRQNLGSASALEAYLEEHYSDPDRILQGTGEHPQWAGEGPAPWEIAASGTPAASGDEPARLPPRTPVH